jgi:phosphoenolpyruvate-protein phosphotransferase
MTRIVLNSPLAGWAMALEDVPDAAFAQRLVGDGVAVDPTVGLLHAPCNGVVVSVAAARHALSLRHPDGLEVLLHVGVDTVALGGVGFEPLVREGEGVSAGQPLLRFDLDAIARRAPSVVTPVLLPSGGKVLRSVAGQLLRVGDFLMEVEFEADSQAPAHATGATAHRRFRLHFEHGLHARPAAQLAAALRPYAAAVSLHARGREANARSTVAMMALGTRLGDEVEVVAIGADADAALDAVARCLGHAEAAAPVATAGSAETPTLAPDELAGVVASRGLALGPAYRLSGQHFDFASTGGDADVEERLLDGALQLAASRADLRAIEAGNAGGGILRAHAELLRDPELRRTAATHLGQGASAPEAWRRAIDDATGALAGLDDARMRERVADLRDIEAQVLRTLVGSGETRIEDLPEQAIVIAEELLPSQLLELPRDRLGGLATARGGPTSHVAIIAASLGIPMLVALGPAVLEVVGGRTLLLDAERGRLRVSPPGEEVARVGELLDARRRQEQADLAAASEPALTRDGTRIAVKANLGAFAEAAGAVARGAEGCGLLRTEFLFLERMDAPGEDEQHAEYRRILDALAPRPLTIRTLDHGGDKPIPYLPLPAEDNPALGLRGLRTGLAHPLLLETQLRAILRLREPERVRILLPMVTEPGDLRTVRALLRRGAQELGIDTLPPLGAMIETPASALLAEAILREADFLSIGSNDLSQYTLAMDRGHPQLSARLDALHPAVLRLVEMVATAAREQGREVAVCGGLASDPEAIALLLGLGVRELSAVPGFIPQLKRILRGLDIDACRALALEALRLEDAASVRKLVLKEESA